MRNISDNIVEKNKTHISYSVTPPSPPKIVAFEIMGKYMVQQNVTNACALRAAWLWQERYTRVRFACRMAMARTQTYTQNI
jgi:hypothetical protein